MQNKRNIEKENSLTKQLGSRIQEGLFIMIVALSVFVLLALITYNYNDPSWTHGVVGTSVNNAGGKAGAWTSDILLYIFGYMAYVFPLMLIYASWLFFRQQAKEDAAENYYFTICKISGFLLILIAGSALSSMHSALDKTDIAFSGGGVLGDTIGSMFVNALGIFGGHLILFALLLAGITLFTGLSWLKVVDVTGQWLMVVIEFMQQRFQKTGNDDSYETEADELKKTKQSKKERKDPPPIIVREEAKTASSKVAAKQEPKFSDEPKAKFKFAKPKILAKHQTDLFEATDAEDLPPLSLLDAAERGPEKGYTKQQLEAMSRDLELRLRDFNVESKVVAVHPGPVITRFEIDLAAGTKVSKITTLAKDLARSMSVTRVRVVEVIPGKSVIGIELPNQHREMVRLSEILSSQAYAFSRSPVTLALGKDIAGHPMVVDLAKMPHLLVAGTTGSGKSVGLNAMLLSLLYKATPEELRMIMIDPKMLELSIYDGVPHLLTPVVTDMKDAANALRWCVAEMERRYKLMAHLGVRNIAGYNAKVIEALNKKAPLLDPLWQESNSMSEAPEELSTLPYIVVVADEFADMMMVVGKKVEELIARLAQKARAAGIHLILATQRPSVDVITGLIKANIPTRIAFQVSSRIDSRTVLDQQGAEQLLGHGDMLYLPPGTGVPIRVHGAYVADEEVHRVTSYLKQHAPPEYLEDIIQAGASTELGMGLDEANAGGDGDNEKDPLYDQAVQIVIESRRASISNIQRRLKIGYNRAARLVETMEAAGIVGPMEHNGSREVLVQGQMQD